MKYFRDVDGNILAFEADGSQDYLIPETAVQLTPEEVDALLNPVPLDEDKIAQYRFEVGQHINSKAVEFGFDSIITAVTYADEPAGPRNQAYGIALREWRSLCWENCYVVLDDWKAGGPEPALADVIAGLPKFIDPVA